MNYWNCGGTRSGPLPMPTASPTFVGQVGIAKAIMYVGELLADRLDTPAPQVYIKPPTPATSISDHWAGTKESPVPICTDGDCTDAQYHADHSAPAVINAEMLGNARMDHWRRLE